MKKVELVFFNIAKNRGQMKNMFELEKQNVRSMDAVFSFKNVISLNLIRTMWCDGVTLSVWIAEGRMTVGEAVSKQSGFPDCPVASGIPEEVAMEREATEADEAPEERGSDGAREAGMP